MLNSFHVLIYHVHILLDEIFLYTFFSFSNWTFFFSPLNFEISLYILDTSLLSDMWFIFFSSSLYLFFFILLAVSFTEHTFCFVFYLVSCVNLYFSETDFDVNLRTFYLSTEDFWCFF